MIEIILKKLLWDEEIKERKYRVIARKELPFMPPLTADTIFIADGARYHVHKILTVDLDNHAVEVAVV